MSQISGNAFVPRLHVDEMDVQPIDRGAELRQRIQADPDGYRSKSASPTASARTGRVRRDRSDDLPGQRVAEMRRDAAHRRLVGPRPKRASFGGAHEHSPLATAQRAQARGRSSEEHDLSPPGRQVVREHASKSSRTRRSFGTRSPRVKRSCYSWKDRCSTTMTTATTDRGPALRARVWGSAAGTGYHANRGEPSATGSTRAESRPSHI